MSAKLGLVSILTVHPEDQRPTLASRRLTAVVGLTRRGGMVVKNEIEIWGWIDVSSKPRFRDMRQRARAGAWGASGGLTWLVVVGFGEARSS